MACGGDSPKIKTRKSWSMKREDVEEAAADDIDDVEKDNDDDDDDDGEGWRLKTSRRKVPLAIRKSRAISADGFISLVTVYSVYTQIAKKKIFSAAIPRVFGQMLSVDVVNARWQNNTRKKINKESSRGKRKHGILSGGERLFCDGEEKVGEKEEEWLLL